MTYFYRHWTWTEAASREILECAEPTSPMGISSRSPTISVRGPFPVLLAGAHQPRAALHLTQRCTCVQSFKWMHFFEERFREFEKELQPKKCCSPVRFDNSRQRLFWFELDSRFCLLVLLRWRRRGLTAVFLLKFAFFSKPFQKVLVCETFKVQVDSSRVSQFQIQIVVHTGLFIRSWDFCWL